MLPMATTTVGLSSIQVQIPLQWLKQTKCEYGQFVCYIRSCSCDWPLHWSLPYNQKGPEHPWASVYDPEKSNCHSNFLFMKKKCKYNSTQSLDIANTFHESGKTFSASPCVWRTFQTDNVITHGCTWHTIPDLRNRWRIQMHTSVSSVSWCYLLIWHLNAVEKRYDVRNVGPQTCLTLPCSCSIVPTGLFYDVFISKLLFIDNF